MLLQGKAGREADERQTAAPRSWDSKITWSLGKAAEDAALDRARTSDTFQSHEAGDEEMRIILSSGLGVGFPFASAKTRNCSDAMQLSREVS